MLPVQAHVSQKTPDPYFPYIMQLLRQNMSLTFNCVKYFRKLCTAGGNAIPKDLSCKLSYFQSKYWSSLLITYCFPRRADTRLCKNGAIRTATYLGKCSHLRNTEMKKNTFNEPRWCINCSKFLQKKNNKRNKQKHVSSDIYAVSRSLVGSSPALGPGHNKRCLDR